MPDIIITYSLAPGSRILLDFFSTTVVPHKLVVELDSLSLRKVLLAWCAILPHAQHSVVHLLAQLRAPRLCALLQHLLKLVRMRFHQAASGRLV